MKSMTILLASVVTVALLCGCDAGEPAANERITPDPASRPAETRLLRVTVACPGRMPEYVEQDIAAMVRAGLAPEAEDVMTVAYENRMEAFLTVVDEGRGARESMASLSRGLPEQAQEAEFELLPPGTELPEISPQMRRVLVIDVSEHGRELGLTDAELAAAIQPYLDANGGEWGQGLPDDAPPMPRGGGLGDISLEIGDEWLPLREVAQVTETMEPDCIVRRLSAGKD